MRAPVRSAPSPPPLAPKAKPPVHVCEARRLDWSGLLAAEQVRLLTHEIDMGHGKTLTAVPQVIHCRGCQASAGSPCRPAAAAR